MTDKVAAGVDGRHNPPIVERQHQPHYYDAQGDTFCKVCGQRMSIDVMLDPPRPTEFCPGPGPIVEQPDRPDWLWEMPRSMLPGTPEARREIMDYIEFLERELAGHRLLRQGYLDKLSDYSLETAKQSVEINRLTDAIHQKDNAFEVCEGRRWEAEERVGELMDEIDRSKPLAARAPMFTRDEEEDFS